MAFSMAFLRFTYLFHETFTTGYINGFPLQEQLPILHVVCYDAHETSDVLLHHVLRSVAEEEGRLVPNIVKYFSDHDIMTSESARD